ncbi:MULTISPECIES: type II secretion system minor pseudopilin GspH [Marinobacter]|uniref:Type II secretion system protein H n=1 Tax=Marinobacter suaedae TaxID=3057675 RepID=A0ABT8W1N7_9GAMM|nr:MULTISPECIES: type II secretion system minor pseudopilin GspH [unclassified Marinobacter]MBZ2168176.1 type II secretion system minor pseudopilin GspH [Marinobacter sp. F4216]MDO3722096.1 type II secretion system minor pseudopilin GspH [Marinobacter sp. chi1]
MPPGKRHYGFTLIEILVVLVVVGLLASLAVMTLGGGSQQRELEGEVRELYLLMQTASEQAILNNAELGLQIESEGYQFFLYDDEKDEWTPSDERLFRARTFPDWMVVTRFSENEASSLSSDNDTIQPDLMFFSSGESTPFELEFNIGRDSDYVHVLASDGFSDVEWRKPGDEDEL